MTKTESFFTKRCFPFRSVLKVKVSRVCYLNIAVVHTPWHESSLCKKQNKKARYFLILQYICIHAPKSRKLWLYWCSNYIFRIMNVLSGKWYVEKFWKKFQMFVWLGPIGWITQRRISCPSECPNHMYRDIFWCSDCNFRSLNVVSGEWYGEKFWKKFEVFLWLRLINRVI